MSDTIPQRQCLDCKNFFPPTADYFHKSPRGRDGLASYCKPCAHARTKRNQQKPKEQARARAYRKTYYQAHKEQILHVHKVWSQENKDYLTAYACQYREENREVLAERWQRWAKTERGYERCRIRVRNRQSRRKGAQGNYTHADIQRIFKAQKGKCYYCFAKLSEYHVEHVAPIIRGGTNDPFSNIVLACPSCNLKKGTKLPHEWPEGGRLL